MDKSANVYGVVTDGPTRPSKCIVAPDGEEETDIDPSMEIPVVVGGVPPSTRLSSHPPVRFSSSVLPFPDAPQELW